MSERAAVRVVGTAGHVDHGKSTLVRALTGIDPDRLEEERRRGMTIDLGFAWLVAPGGTEIGLVDVPGHEDFIRNMVAGVGGIDAALLVIASDEGVRPQTREHLAILGLLGVERAVIALTKRDLVDAEWVDLVRADLATLLADSPLAAAPVIEVSATDRRGLDALVAALEATLAAAPPRRDMARPRLPVDRVFTMAGFGTVLTGTLLDGSLAVGDDVELVPGGARGRIRGLQTHRRSIEVARPGSRVAVNVTGVEKSDAERGAVLVRVGMLAPTSTIAARIELLPTASAPVERDETVKVHTGTAEVMARVALLDTERLAPGAGAWAHLHLAAPIAAAVDDRLVLRRPSPPETIGGGVVADAAPVRARRAAAVADLERRTVVDPRSRLLAALDAPRTREEAGERAGIDAATRDAALADLVASGDVRALGDAFLTRAGFDALATTVERAVAAAHRRAPLRPGLPREEARAVSGLAQRRFNALVTALVREERVAERGPHLALPGHRPSLSVEDEARWSSARADLERPGAGVTSPNELASRSGLGADQVGALVERGSLVRLGPDALALPDTVVAFADAAIAEIARARTLTVSRARDLVGTSRKHVLPLLQHLDDIGVTRRAGDDRILVLAPEDARERVRALTQRREGRR